MRILFTFAGGSGHFEPLAPVARAAQAAGHTVAFAAQPVMLPVVEAAGFAAFATGGATLSAAPRRQALLPVDLEREDRDLAEGFARRLARERAGAVLALCADWRPDLLVCDEIDFGAVVAAERLGLPHASVLVIAEGSLVRRAVVGAPLEELRAAHGLPPDPQLAMLSRYLVLSPCPPGFRSPAFPLPPTAHAIRPAAAAPAPPETAWAPPAGAGPLVYFTLGTVFNVESGDLLERALAGLRGLPARIVATVGREIDPAELGPQPPNVQIARYIPQAALLPHCAAVVSHGGSGSVMGALAHGLPMLLLPMGADQPRNADRCAQLGLARQLDPLAATPEDVRAAAADILADPAYRRAAGRLRDEIAGLPGPDHAVALLERLAAERRPILAPR